MEEAVGSVSPLWCFVKRWATTLPITSVAAQSCVVTFSFSTLFLKLCLPSDLAVRHCSPEGVH